MPRQPAGPVGTRALPTLRGLLVKGLRVCAEEGGGRTCLSELVPSVNVRSLPRFKNHSDPPAPEEEVESGVVCVARVVGRVQRRSCGEARRRGDCALRYTTPGSGRAPHPRVLSGGKSFAVVSMPQK